MRKGQLGNLQGIVVTLVVVGIILGVGLYVFAEFQEQESIGESESGDILLVNETLTTVDEIGETVTNANLWSNFKMKTGASVICFNVTNQVLVPTTNRTETSGGVIRYSGGGGVGSIEFNNSDWNCTYSWTYGGVAWEGVNKTIQAVNKIPGWLAIIVIISIVGIVLAILFAVFPSGGTSGAGKGFGSVGSFGGKGGGEGTAEM